MTNSSATPRPVSTSPSNSVLALWRFFTAIPGGKAFFDRVLDHRVPYAASIAKSVEVLKPGHCLLEMRDQRAVHNHRDVVHAAAILNLAETAAGLALQSLLPTGLEPVVKSTSLEHRKTARGPLTAECTLAALAPEGAPQVTEVLVRDSTRDIVAEVAVTWRLSALATA